MENFNDIFRKRSMDMAVSIIRLYKILYKDDEIRIIGKQIIRSATSVAANFR